MSLPEMGLYTQTPYDHAPGELDTHICPGVRFLHHFSFELNFPGTCRARAKKSVDLFFFFLSSNSLPVRPPPSSSSSLSSPILPKHIIYPVTFSDL